VARLSRIAALILRMKVGEFQAKMDVEAARRDEAVQDNVV
jgi:hypothetical protein